MADTRVLYQRFGVWHTIRHPYSSVIVLDLIYSRAVDRACHIFGLEKICEPEAA